MVGCSDIPCVGKIVDRISDAMVDPLFRGFNYMFCYKDRVNVLDSEIRKLTNYEGRVSRRIDAEQNNGKTIDIDVTEWQQEVKQIQTSAKEFLEKYKNRSSWRCIPCMPIPKPVSRFKLGREAVQMVKQITELYNSGEGYLENYIAYLPPVENVPVSDTVFQDFKSRKDAYEKLWEALVAEEDSCMIVGIYGMPGVGKTRMMEQLWKEAKDKNIFDKVTSADVGNEKLDMKKLQNQIAGHLGCCFESEDDEKKRANQLKNSLMNGGKILVILDDVWREIPLDAIGIPLGDCSGSKGIKILLTSREEDVCLRNNCKHPIKITTLTGNEAWDLFKNTVGACQIDSLQDNTLAGKVCNKCAGLPLLIRAVGKALQFASHNSWKDALGQLEKGKFENIAGIDPEVYACVKLSFDKLPDNAKSCLYLCSLFPEDASILIRELIQLATGSLVPDGETRIRAMVDILRSSSLLLDCQEDHIIKLHDLIRDVARSIAVRDPEYAFKLVRCGSRLPDDADYSTRKLMHLHVEDSRVRFPKDLFCPDLHNLWLQCGTNVIPKFSGGFLSNLRFLWIQGGSFFSHVSSKYSLHCLGKLRMLILDDCDMADINKNNDRFFPENLETLCIWNCRIPLLLKLPDLKYLRKLEIRTKFKKVPMLPNAISSLRNLEELHIPNGIQILDPSYLEELLGSQVDLDGSGESDEMEMSMDGSDISIDGDNIRPRETPILMEISKLTNMRSLQMLFSDSEPFQDSHIFGNLLEYDILVGDPNRACALPLDPKVPFKRSIKLIKLVGNQREVLLSLIEMAEDLKSYCTDISVGSIYDRNRKAFSYLRNLYIDECKAMEYLARISQGDIQHSCQPSTSFSKLTNLHISECHAIKYLFSNSVAKCLVQLQEVYIVDCRLMEAFVMNEQGTSDGEDIINFSKLKSLKLSHLPRLKRFFREKKEMQTQHSGSTSIIHNSAIPLVKSQSLFDGVVAFPSLEVLELTYLEGITDIWGNHFCNENVSSSSSFSKVKTLVVEGCDIQETVFPRAMSKRLQNMEYLAIWNCNRLRNVFQHSSVARDLIKQLKTIYVVNCTTTAIIEAGEEEEEESTNIIVFPELTKLELTRLPNLTAFWGHQRGEDNACKVHLPNLVHSNIECDGINLEDIGLGNECSTSQPKCLDISCDKDIQLQ